jgi:hypothetical protein
MASYFDGKSARAEQVEVEKFEGGLLFRREGHPVLQWRAEAIRIDLLPSGSARIRLGDESVEVSKPEFESLSLSLPIAPVRHHFLLWALGAALLASLLVYSPRFLARSVASWVSLKQERNLVFGYRRS